jgi:hypothetical protein
MPSGIIGYLHPSGKPGPADAGYQWVSGEPAQCALSSTVKPFVIKTYFSCGFRRKRDTRSSVINASSSAASARYSLSGPRGIGAPGSNRSRPFRLRFNPGEDDFLAFKRRLALRAGRASLRNGDAADNQQ